MTARRRAGARTKSCGDLVAGRRCRRSRHRDGLRAAERLDDVAQAEKFGAEIVTPLRDAMGLVDGDRARSEALRQCDHVVAREPLGGDVEEASVPSFMLRVIGAARRSVEELSAAASTPSARSCATWSRMSAIRGETTSVRLSRTIGEAGKAGTCRCRSA